MAKSIVIMGSARSEGKTREAVDLILGSDSSIPIVDLSELDISPFDYEHKNKDDDYLPLMKNVLEHDIIILATPVYWYSVSTIMKIFIDRVTDLITIEKDMGRQLRGKKLYIIASYSTSLPKHFEAPLEQTCEYLGMEYLGCSYICSNESNELYANNESEIDNAKGLI